MGGFKQKPTGWELAKRFRGCTLQTQGRSREKTRDRYREGTYSQRVRARAEEGSNSLSSPLSDGNSLCWGLPQFMPVALTVNTNSDLFRVDNNKSEGYPL